MMKHTSLASQFQSDVRPCIQGDGSLMISTGANQIKWGYGLNTVTYPTYGGEVVQILSAYITDMDIGGDVQSYMQMEDIYIWFLVYMNTATQGPSDAGQPGTSSYNEEPVSMWYPEREWTFKLRPKSLPGLRMARDVVAPTWAMTASIVEGDPEAEAFTLKGAMDGLQEIQAGIGYTPDNPFSGPSTSDSPKQIVDSFQTIVKGYNSGDFSSLDGGSAPAPDSSASPKTDKVEAAKSSKSTAKSP